MNRENQLSTTFYQDGAAANVKHITDYKEISVKCALTDVAQISLSQNSLDYVTIVVSLKE